jgi:hypothetical protein
MKYTTKIPNHPDPCLIPSTSLKGMLATCFCWLLAWRAVGLRKWRQCAPLKHQAVSRVHGVTTQKTILFKHEKVLMRLNSKLKETSLI